MNKKGARSSRCGRGCVNKIGAKRVDVSPPKPLKRVHVLPTHDTGGEAQ